MVILLRYLKIKNNGNKPLIKSFVRHAINIGEVCDGLRDGERHAQCRVLWHVARDRVVHARLAPEHSDLALMRLDPAKYEPEQSGLAGTARSQQAIDLAVGYTGVDVAQNLIGLIAERYVGHRYGCHLSGREVSAIRRLK